MRVRLFLLALLAACGDDEPKDPGPPPVPAKPPAPPSGIPDRVTYDQILIAFHGSYPRAEATRTRAEAEGLAYALLARLRAGESFHALKEEYTDDRSESGRPQGPYHTVKDGLRREGMEVPRSHLYPGPGELIYGLKPGDFGIVDCDPKRCPIGWLIILRLQ
jgi:hypothetical protein